MNQPPPHTHTLPHTLFILCKCYLSAILGQDMVKRAPWRAITCEMWCDFSHRVFLYFRRLVPCLVFDCVRDLRLRDVLVKWCDILFFKQLKACRNVKSLCLANRAMKSKQKDPTKSVHTLHRCVISRCVPRSVAQTLSHQAALMSMQELRSF